MPEYNGDDLALMGCQCGCNQRTPIDTTITALRVARLTMDRLTGYPAATVYDMVDAINDIIAGAEELQRERTD